MNWQVYIILCSDGTFYTGITTDIERRLRQHQDGRGAKYFRGRKPKELLYLEGGHDRSSASRREAYIKALTRTEKERLLSSHSAATTLQFTVPRMTAAVTGKVGELKIG